MEIRERSGRVILILGNDLLGVVGVHFRSVLWESERSLREEILEFVDLSQHVITPESLSRFPSIHPLLHLIGHLLHNHIQVGAGASFHTDSSTAMENGTASQMNTFRDENLICTFPFR